MARLRMRSSDLKGHLHSMKIIESSACSCGFKNEDEIHFFLACPLYYRPRVTLLNALAHIAPLTVRTLLYGNDTYEIEEKDQLCNKCIYVFELIVPVSAGKVKAFPHYTPFNNLLSINLSRVALVLIGASFSHGPYTRADWSVSLLCPAA